MSAQPGVFDKQQCLLQIILTLCIRKTNLQLVCIDGGDYGLRLYTRTG